MGQLTFQYPSGDCANGIVPNSANGCVASLAYSIRQMYPAIWGENTRVRICGYLCVGSLKNLDATYKWIWTATFQCVSKPNIGSATLASKGPDATMEAAITNWIVASSLTGNFKAEEFKC
ncbi:unnamed protein product [Adineta steineri]|uniref:Uncharacterized protein n=1 Tax=Adineta steineri TaxID=433720 RepID=A0A819QTE7_9BILA|nr:unnamed protein product [Adineta steineri]CAF4034656.1 unnamed protein product [Adineta steineri]